LGGRCAGDGGGSQRLNAGLRGIALMLSATVFTVQSWRLDRRTHTKGYIETNGVVIVGR